MSFVSKVGLSGKQGVNRYSEQSEQYQSMKDKPECESLRLVFFVNLRSYPTVHIPVSIGVNVRHGHHEDPKEAEHRIPFCDITCHEHSEYEQHSDILLNRLDF